MDTYRQNRPNQLQLRHRHHRRRHRLKRGRLRNSRADELQIRAGSLRRGRRDEFLEARIIPEWIKHRIEA